jgi:hypothetical protein
MIAAWDPKLNNSQPLRLCPTVSANSFRNDLPILAPSCPKSNPDKINPANETPAINGDLSVVPIIRTANRTVFLCESVLAKPDTIENSYPVMLVANVEYRSNVIASARLLLIDTVAL